MIDTRTDLHSHPRMSMEESSPFLSSQRYAVVTDANKGFGLEVCLQLARKGVAVVLTSRDERRGLEALQKLKEERDLSSHPGQSDFPSTRCYRSKEHRVTVGFIETRFGKLDILVNNAGIHGFVMDPFPYAEAVELLGSQNLTDLGVWRSFVRETVESIKDCLETNYYGTKRMCEALLPMLQLSSSPRIVNVSSDLGRFKNVPGEKVRSALGDIENLTGDRVDEILQEFEGDFQLGQLVAAKGWPENISAYRISKAAVNAYTRLLAKEFPAGLVNCVCPGDVKTDMTCDSGHLSASEGAESVVHLALLPENGPSGVFFIKKDVSSF